MLRIFTHLELAVIQSGANIRVSTISMSLHGEALFVFQVSCDCCVALPRGAMGLSAVCDCGIS